MIRSLALLSILMLHRWPAEANQTAESFVLNQSNPYVYLKFDHVGPRTPFMDGEPDTGVWIRIVNNCRVSILVPAVGPNSKGESVVLDEVVRSGQHAVKISASGPTTDSSTTDARPNPPQGYEDYSSDVQAFTTIAPGQSLLFSLPLNHLVGGDWYMRVRFSLDIPGSEHGPYSYADSFTVQIPSEYTRRGIPKSR
jgi:hypothetical protein